MKVFEKNVGCIGNEYYLVSDNNDEHAQFQKSVTNDFNEIVKEKATTQLPLIRALGGKIRTTDYGVQIAFHFKSAAETVANIINKNKTLQV